MKFVRWCFPSLFGSPAATKARKPGAAQPWPCGTDLPVTMRLRHGLPRGFAGSQLVFGRCCFPHRGAPSLLLHRLLRSAVSSVPPHDRRSHLRDFVILAPRCFRQETAQGSVCLLALTATEATALPEEAHVLPVSEGPRAARHEGGCTAQPAANSAPAGRQGKPWK